jgi:hypothetical protein
MLLVGFEPVIPASQRPQTHALDRAATLQHTLTDLYKSEKEEEFCALVIKTALLPSC